MTAIAAYRRGEGPLKTPEEVISYCRLVAAEERRFGSKISADVIELLIEIIEKGRNKS